MTAQELIKVFFTKFKLFNEDFRIIKTCNNLKFLNGLEHEA